MVAECGELEAELGRLEAEHGAAFAAYVNACEKRDELCEDVGEQEEELGLPTTDLAALAPPVQGFTDLATSKGHLVASPAARAVSMPDNVPTMSYQTTLSRNRVPIAPFDFATATCLQAMQDHLEMHNFGEINRRSGHYLTYHLQTMKGGYLRNPLARVSDFRTTGKKDKVVETMMRLLGIEK